MRARPNEMIKGVLNKVRGVINHSHVFCASSVHITLVQLDSGSVPDVGCYGCHGWLAKLCRGFSEQSWLFKANKAVLVNVECASQICDQI